MSISSRRRPLSSLRNVALVSFLIATLFGAVGCAGGSNPFCCNSKEKDQVDHLERAQSLDENEKNTTPTEENSDENQEEEKKSPPLQAENPLPDGSGDATQIAAANATPKTFKQEVPVTVSPSDAAQNATATNDALLPAPALPPVQTPQAAPPAATPVETAPEETNATPVETAPEETNATPENDVASETSAPTVDSPAGAEQTAVDAQEVQDAQDAPQEEPQDAQKPSEVQEEKTPETPVNVARTSRRNGPQRAATRQVAQRASNRTVAVPQTRAASTLSAPTPVVGFRTRAVVPAVSPSAAPTTGVTFRTRTVVP